MRPRRRRRTVALLLLGVAAFLVVSALLARVLAANGAERTAIDALLRAQVRGDAAAMAAQIDGCAASAACRARVAANAAGLHGPGPVVILRLDASTSFSLGGSTGTARVAWNTKSRLTVVQCVRVRRGGNPIGGLSIHLLALSPPIGRESSCPKAF